MEQIHSNIVKVINETETLYKCDALVTDKYNIPLMVMVADCIPILFYDMTKNIIAVAHAGRAGTFENISGNTIDTMIKEFNCNPKDIVADLGPSIQKCCYEVSLELVDETATTFGEQFVFQRNIDLQGINKQQLLEKGLQEKNITISNTCTKCSNKPYFSYRKDNSCGRFAGIIIQTPQR